MSDLYLLDNSQILDLYEIKVNDFEGYLYIHGSKNVGKDIVFLGQKYIYLPCEMSNLEYNSDGKQGRPTFTVSNANNFFSNFIKDRSDLLGKRFYRKKIFAKDLDAENFGGEYKNTLGSSAFVDYISVDTFVINKKNVETKEKIEFTLSSILDIDGITAPTRKVYNDFCSWNYRGPGCNYGKIANYDGPPILVESFDISYDSLGSVLALDDMSGLDSNLILWLRPEGLKSREDSGADDFYKSEFASWSNDASTINGSAPSIPITYGGNSRYVRTLTVPYESTKRALSPYTNNAYLRIGHDFSASPSSTNYTIFIVFKLQGNQEIRQNFTLYPSEIYLNTAEGLLTSGDKAYWVLGGNNVSPNYKKGREPYYDRFKIENTVINNGSINPSQMSRNKTCYSTVLTQNSGETKFFKNNVLLKSATGYNNRPNGDGFLYLGGIWSTVYEIIIFDAALTNSQVGRINYYLSSRHGFPVGTVSSTISSVTKNGGDFFAGFEDGNLGVPVADENNKTFFTLDSAIINKKTNSYGFNTLNYQGDYNKDKVYQRGDFVKIDAQISYDFNEDYLQQDFEIPSRFFVCVSDQSVSDIHPLKRTDVWIEDKCSKNLNGCSLRFRGDNNIKIPFGGFPGTVTYEYKLPNS